MSASPVDSDSTKFRLPLWIFLLVLPVYAALAVGIHSTDLIWDEGRYLEGAAQLAQGTFPPDEHRGFVNGPGYPLFLSAFVQLNAPLLSMRIANGLLIALASMLIFITARPSAGPIWSAVGAIGLALHPLLLRVGPYLMSEALTIFTLALFAWASAHLLRRSHRSWLWIGIGTLALAWLILTRVFFGYVAMAMIPTCIVLLVLIRPWREPLRNLTAVYLGGLLLCLPYLNHTFEKTGQFPCWSTNSGELFYWLTSTHEGENGSWFSPQDVAELPHLSRNHGAFYEHVMELPYLKREEQFKQAAKAHLESNPKGVFYNWLCNIPRLAFGFPRSFVAESPVTFIVIATSGPVILFSLASLLLTLRHWRETDPVPLMLGLMALIYIGGSTLAPAQPRYLVMVFPLLWIVSTITLKRYLTVRW